MAGPASTPPDFPTEAQHPLVAALSIFGGGRAPGSAEREAEGDADLCEAPARCFVRLGAA
ncbi:hypothetical protein ABZ848_23255 [Streptomyces sp. NPDC047081]|uniref:hypothetical protein n=1 Tax=Streptomyces sp. NPDC047081 TaxID=3154706 RepID=UPI0033FB3646